MTAYVFDGILQHGRQTSTSVLGIRTSLLQYLSWRRVSLVLLLTSLAMLTNPMNSELFSDYWDHSVATSDSSSEEETTKLWFDQLLRTAIDTIDQLRGRGATNYLVFSVWEDHDALVFQAFSEVWPCEYHHAELGGVCRSLAASMLHGKSILWDKMDPVHTAHRALCWLLILSLIASFCCPRAPPGRRICDNMYLDAMIGVLRPHNLLSNLWYINIAVYPALVEYYRMVPRLDHRRSIFLSGNRDLDFAMGVIVLVAGIGGGSNLLASRLSKSPQYGISSVIAASLAYYQRILVLQEPILLYIWDQPVTAAALYWTTLLGSVVWGQDRRNWVPQVMSWMIGGWIGSVLAKYHLENVAVLGGLFKYFGLP